jgi:TonB family protein
MRAALIGWLGVALACAPASAFAKEPTQPLAQPPHAGSELASPLKEAVVPAQAAAFAEEAPPVGKGSMFSDAQIRYCLAQIIRIEAVRSLINRYRKAQVEYFNGVTADYNSRCGSYRYEGDALETNRALVEANRWQIQSIAREAYTKRFGSDEKPVAASKPPVPPQTEPAPAAAALPPDQFPAPPPQAAESASPSPTPASPAVESRSPRAEPADRAPAASASRPQASTPSQVEPRSTRAEQAAANVPAVPAAKPQAVEPPARATQEKTARDVAAAPTAEPRTAATPAVPSPPATPAGASQEKAVPEIPAAPTAKPRAGPPPAVASPPAGDRSAAESDAAAQPSMPRSTAPAVAAARPAPATRAPPPPAKAAAESAPGPVWDRFARDVRRAGFQVIDAHGYPEAARDKDWEGTAQVDVHYAAGGFIKSIVLGESSGHAPLDERALQIARNIRFPDVPEELQSRDFAVRFPIVFRLHKTR